MPDPPPTRGPRRRRPGRPHGAPELELVRRVRVRRRLPRSPLHNLLIKPSQELLRSMGVLGKTIWRNPLGLVVLGAGGLWLAWPTISPRLPLIMGLGAFEPTTPPPEVIAVFVEDPQRTIKALELWRRKPGSLLVMQGRPSSQLDNRLYLQHQGKWPRDERGLIRLEPGCDTVAQVGALAQLLEGMTRSGHLTMVTSPAHLPRTLAVTRIVIGPLGWRVDGQAAVTGDNRPEHPLRYWRDQLRAQLLRLTGISGSEPDEKCT